MNDKKRLNSYKDLPLVLDVADIQRIMGISRASAYELVHTPGFPAFRAGAGLSRLAKLLSLNGWQKAPKLYREVTNKHEVLSPDYNTAVLSKGAYRGKNLKNDTETLHQNRLSVYIR